MDHVVPAQGADRDTAVARAATALRDGHLVVLPTDTVYGVAADAFNPQGTRKIFAAKGRDRRFPLPVLVRSPKQLPGLSPQLPEAAERLMAAYWPGPLTLVVPAHTGLRWDLGDNDGTVAVRMPLDEVALAVIREVGPLSVTSANLAGQPPAATTAQAREQLGDAVELYLDDGARRSSLASTIIDLTRSQPQVLRVGVIDTEQALQVARGELDPLEAGAQLDAQLAEGADEPDTGGATAPGVSRLDEDRDDDAARGLDS